MNTTHDDENPITILIYITDKCNMNCVYCYNIFPRNNNDLDQDCLLKFIDDVNFKTHRKLNILLIGGEPTLYKNIHSLISELKNRQFVNQIEVFTNFSRDMSFYNDLLSNDIKLVCSWHDEIDDRSFITNLNNISNDMVDNIVEISMMFEHDNCDRWSNVIDGIRHKYSRVIRPWILYHKEKIFEYEEYQKKIFARTVLKLNKVKIQDFLHTENPFNSIFDYFSDPYQESFINKICSAGFDTLYIHNNGNVYKCQNDFFYDKPKLYNIMENNSIFDMSCYHNWKCVCEYCRHGNFGVTVT